MISFRSLGRDALASIRIDMWAREQLDAGFLEPDRFRVNII